MSWVKILWYNWKGSLNSKSKSDASYVAPRYDETVGTLDLCQACLGACLVVFDVILIQGQLMSHLEIRSWTPSIVARSMITKSINMASTRSQPSCLNIRFLSGHWGQEGSCNCAQVGIELEVLSEKWWLPLWNQMWACEVLMCIF